MTNDILRSHSSLMVYIQGLITSTRPDVVSGKLASHKKYFVRDDTSGKEYPDLLSVLEYVKPTALVGLSTTSGAFPEPVVRQMSSLNELPIIFPLSNPTSKCELHFNDALEWTDGRFLFASGSPYDPITFKGKYREPGQGNNFLVFPGIGFGALACGATKISDKMITASAIGLSLCVNEKEKEVGLMYPRLERIREVSARVSAEVVKQAQKEGLDTVKELRGLGESSLIHSPLERHHPFLYLSLLPDCMPHDHLYKWLTFGLLEDIDQLTEKMKEMQWWPKY